MSAPPASLPFFHIDAFTRRVFGGNAAAVLPLSQWLPDTVLQAIAAEHNLSETAFVLGAAGRYELRWFTPTQEVGFCGHATLAAAWALWERLGETAERLSFGTRAGELCATRGPDELIVLDLPRFGPLPSALTPAELTRGLGVPVLDTFTSADGYDSVFAVLKSARAVRLLAPDFAQLDGVSDLVVTAAGDEPDGRADFVSRVFCPGVGVAEDPVTGSAHSTLTPYWAAQLGRGVLLARQLSARGGELRCEVRAGRVQVGGHAALYAEGRVFLPGAHP